MGLDFIGILWLFGILVLILVTCYLIFDTWEFIKLVEAKRKKGEY